MITLYVKHKGLDIIKYPYDFQDLVSENPGTKYNTKKDITEYYNTTEEAFENGYILSSVILQNQEFDDETRMCIYDELPTFENDQWILKSTVIEKVIVIDTEFSNKESI